LLPSPSFPYHLRLSSRSHRHPRPFLSPSPGHTYSCTLFLHHFLTSKNILLLGHGILRHPGQRSSQPSSKIRHNLAQVHPDAFSSSVDLDALIRRTIKLKGAMKTTSNQQKLLAQVNQVKTVFVPWFCSILPSRKLEITLTRLKFGHTRITHTHLLSQLFPLDCRSSKNDSPLTVDYLVTCHQLTTLRNTHNIPHDHPSALSNKPGAILDSFSFLHSIQLLHLI